MASPAIENRLLRIASFRDLAMYFKQLLTRLDNGILTDHLLSGLETDSLPFRTIAVWIAGFADAPSIVEALRYEKSAGVRRLAIKRFVKCLRREMQTQAVLDAVGGTSGLVELFAELSVHDVQSFCHALGRTCTWSIEKERRQTLLTELVQKLLSKENPEKRAFIKFYSNIVPACTVEFVRSWEADETLPRAGGRWMDHAHYEHTRARCLRHLTAENGKNFKFKYFENVVHELPPTRASKYMSQSMLFSLELLDFLGEHEEVKMSSNALNDNIFSPLIRRLNKRGAPHDVRARVLRSVAKALNTRIDDGGIIDMNEHGPLRNAVACWNSDSVAHRQLLLDIMDLVPAKQQHVALDRIATLLGMTRWPLRHELLSLATKHLKPLAKDLEKDGDLNEMGPWPASIFGLLPADKSKSLLRRLFRLRLKDTWGVDLFMVYIKEHAAPLLKQLSQTRPAGDFIDWHPGTHLSDPIFKIPHNRDVALLQLYAEPRSTERDSGWQSVIDERKKEAGRARDQAERATWVRSAILCSASSGSLDLYEQTLTWLRKFNSDPLTVKTIYQKDNICTDLAVKLLSATSSDTAEDLAANLAKGNKIMLILLENAFQGLREPSFQPYDWAAVLLLFKAVVQARLDEAHEVQDRLSLSDAHMYDAVWQGTLRTVLLAEEQCLMDEHEKLNAQSLSGILGRLDRQRTRSMRPHECRFVDDLAKHRDELWARRRIAKDPNVVSIPAPFPAGLSFQHAESFSSGDHYQGCTPYLESRAEAVVFAHPTAALSPCPTDRETCKAINYHVDDYNTALRFYVHAGADEEERERRKQKAWGHASGPLTESRGLPATHIKRFWRPHFGDWPSVLSAESDLDLPARPDPTIPATEDEDGLTEWHPDPDTDQYRFPIKTLEPTCLDVMLEPEKTSRSIGVALLSVPKVTVGGGRRSAMWEEPGNRPMRTITPAGREGLVALGLMLVNIKCSLDVRLFSKPFPSAEDARFPAMYLDEEFLERDDISEEDGFLILEKLSRDAPLTIVAQLCEAMLSKRDQGGKDDLYFGQATLRLLKILVESDRPDLALNLVRKVVLERPQDSSWHRHMLTQGLFDRMKSGQARRFLDEVATGMKESLQVQGQPRTESGQDPERTSSARIKITTITALAQLLSRATFVSGNETVDVLIDIFHNTRHPDARVAIVSSLTSLLKKSRRAKVKARIIDALEEHAVPVASSMSERSPMSEKDWQNAEAALEPPEVNEPESKTLQPVLSAILDAYGALADETAVAQVYRRILLPILDGAVANNRRWMLLFLRKHGLHCRVEELPLLPPKPHYLHDILKKDVQDRREGIFRLRREVIMANLNPSRDLYQVNDTILKRKDLRASNGGKHWLALFHNHGTAALSVTKFPLHHYLTIPANATPGHKARYGIQPGAVPYPILQETVRAQLDLMVNEYDARAAELDVSLSDLAHPVHRSPAQEEHWDVHARPLIRHVMDKIEGMRTPEWQRQSHRSPATLRDTYDLRIWLLTWPRWSNDFHSRPDHKERLATFADEVSAMVTELARGGKPYHHRFPQLKNLAGAVNPKDLASLALRFGSGWEELRLEDYLSIELAETFLERVEEPGDEGLVIPLGRMIEGWKGSADERVRRTGRRVAAAFEGGRKGKKGWFWERWGRERGL